MRNRYLMTAVAAGLIAFASLEYATVDAASTVKSKTSSNVSSTVNSSNSVNSSSTITSSTSSGGSQSSIVTNNGSTVSNSSDVGGTSSSITNSVTNNGSMCSAEINGRRCDIRCRTPHVAQCGKAADAMEPSCICQ